MITIDQFVARKGIRMGVAGVSHNPNVADWGPGVRHFKCVLRASGRRMTVYFSQGAAHEREPTEVEVLECLAGDAAGYENAGSFADWAADYGYDPDSRKAEKIYNTISGQIRALKKFLGNAYEILLWETKRRV